MGHGLAWSSRLGPAGTPKGVGENEPGHSPVLNFQLRFDVFSGRQISL